MAVFRCIFNDGNRCCFIAASVFYARSCVVVEHRPTFPFCYVHLRTRANVSLVVALGVDDGEIAGYHRRQAIDERIHRRATDAVSVAPKLCERGVMRHIEFRQAIV